MVRLTMAFVLGAVAVAVAGCGNSQAVLVNDLRHAGIVYYQYHDLHQKGPANWEELIQIDKSTGGDGTSIERVRAAGYQMKWDVRFLELTEPTANIVLAENPSGGPTLMMDASVRH